jgi:PAS domain-containing protein
VQILILCLGCSLQAWTGAALWRRLSHLTHERRPTQRNVSLFMVVCLALGLIGGALSTVAVWINQHPVSWTQWSQCVVAHTLGAFVMTPLLLHTSTLRARLKDRAWCRELALFAAAVVGACSLLYAGMAPALSIGFILGPVLGWGALRLRLDGTVLLNLIVAGISIPFLTMHQPEHLLSMSMLLSVCIGSALLMAGLSDDITQHDHHRGKIVERLESAYHALQNQEHQLRTLFDHLPDPIVVIDDTTLYYANEAAHRLHTTLFPSQPQASRWLAIVPTHRLLSDECTLRAEDGLDHILEIRCTPFA